MQNRIRTYSNKAAFINQSNCRNLSSYQSSTKEVKRYGKVLTKRIKTSLEEKKWNIARKINSKTSTLVSFGGVKRKVGRRRIGFWGRWETRSIASNEKHLQSWKANETTTNFSQKVTWNSRLSTAVILNAAEVVSRIIVNPCVSWRSQTNVTGNRI